MRGLPLPDRSVCAETVANVTSGTRQVTEIRIRWRQSGKRRGDACALRKLRETQDAVSWISHEVLWSAMRLRIAFKGGEFVVKEGLISVMSLKRVKALNLEAIHESRISNRFFFPCFVIFPTSRERNVLLAKCAEMCQHYFTFFEQRRTLPYARINPPSRKDTAKAFASRRRGSLGSACVSRVGFGVAPKQAFQTFRAQILV